MMKFVRLFLYAFGIALICGTLIFGAAVRSQRGDAPRWNVDLVRPDGTAHRRWIVKSHSEPKVDTRWGGTTELFFDVGGAGPHKYTSSDLIAPVGWLFETNRRKEP